MAKPEDSLLGRTLRVALGKSSRLAPAIVAPLAWRLFCTPLEAPPPPNAATQKRLERGRALVVDAGSHKLPTRVFGKPGDPTLLLVHGWGSRGFLWLDLAEDLEQRGFRVVIFDGPGHGAEGPKRTNLPRFAAALHALEEALGPFEGVVGHSFGGFASAWALAGWTAERPLKAPRLVTIGTPEHLSGVVENFRRILDLSPQVVDHMDDWIQARTGRRIKDITLSRVVREAGVKAVHIHDREDKEVPFSEAEAASEAGPGTLSETVGLGHRRIVRAPEVAAIIAEVMSADLAEPCPCP